MFISDETRSKKMWMVYIHINKLNGKRYVGVTSRDPKERWRNNGGGYKTQPKFYRAIKKYGWGSFEHIIVAKGLSVKGAEALEKELVEKYDCIENGYNSREGGFGFDRFELNQQTVDEIIERNGTKVCQYSLSGDYIATYRSMREAERITGIDSKNISRCANLARNKYPAPYQAYGYQWLFFEDCCGKNKIAPYYTHSASHFRTPVVQFSLAGNYVSRHKSVTAAAEAIGISEATISKCLAHPSKKLSAGGYQWKYEKDVIGLDHIDPHPKFLRKNKVIA